MAGVGYRGALSPLGSILVPCGSAALGQRRTLEYPLSPHLETINIEYLPIVLLHTTTPCSQNGHRFSVSKMPDK